MPDRRPIILTNPYPTALEVAKSMGISVRRARELDRMMEAYFREERQRLGKWSKPRRGRDDRSRARAK